MKLSRRERDQVYELKRLARIRDQKSIEEIGERAYNQERALALGLSPAVILEAKRIHISITNRRSADRKRLINRVEVEARRMIHR